MTAHPVAAKLSSTSPPSPDALNQRAIVRSVYGLLAAVFIALLSSTIVLVALPTIVTDLHGNASHLTWMITIQLLASATTTPIWGKIADLSDKKALLQAAVGTLVTASLLAGCAPTMTILLAGRALQGVGMGGTVAVTVATVSTLIPPRQQGRYAGHLGAVLGASMAGGPLLGGLLVDSALGWRACFLVCVPLSFLTVIVLRRILPTGSCGTQKVKIDWLGATLLTAGASILLVWISFTAEAGSHEWFSWQSAGYVAAGGGLLAVGIVVEARTAEPVVPLKIITERTTACTIVASVTVGIEFYTVPAYLSQYLQAVRGMSSTSAGVYTLPMLLGLFVASLVSGNLITRFGRWKEFLLAGALFQTMGFAALSYLDDTTPLWLIALDVAIVGVGTGILVNNLLLPVQNTVSVSAIGAATGSVMFFRSFGGAIGLSILGSLLATRVTLPAWEKAELGGGSTTSPTANDVAALPQHVADVLRHEYCEAISFVFALTAAIAAVAVVALLLIPNRPLRTTVDEASKE